MGQSTPTSLRSVQPEGGPAAQLGGKGCGSRTRFYPRLPMDLASYVSFLRRGYQVEQLPELWITTRRVAERIKKTSL